MDAAASAVLSALGSTPVQVKVGPGEVTDVLVYNPTGNIAYVQLFDVAGTGNVTLGNTAAHVVIPVPPGACAAPISDGIGFYTGIVAAATTTPTGNTSPASGLQGTIGIR